MKKLLVCLTLISFFLFIGCEKDDTNQEEKNDYIAMKSNLVSKEEFDDAEDMKCDISISVDRIDKETISYITYISNIKEDMNDIKVLVVHNYFTEDVFPSIGIFDEPTSLKVSDNKNISLVGYIDTTKDIRKLNLELKVWIQYTDNFGEVKDIYYKTTK